MAETFKPLAQTYADTSAGTIYTVPVSTATIIKHIRVVNEDVATRTIALLHNSNYILPATSIAAGGWAEYDGTICMSASDTLAADGEAASVLKVSVYGVEIT